MNDAGALAMVAALALAAPEAAPPEWRLAGYDAATATFIDMKSLARSGDDVRFWSKGVARRRQPTEDIRNLMRVNCRKFTYQILGSHFLLGDMPVLGGPGRVARARPGKVAYDMVRVACGLKPPGEAAADPPAYMKSFWGRAPR